MFNFEKTAYFILLILMGSCLGMAIYGITVVVETTGKIGFSLYFVETFGWLIIGYLLLLAIFNHYT